MKNIYYKEIFDLAKKEKLKKEEKKILIESIAANPSIINEKDSFDKTILHKAVCSKDNIYLIQLLLSMNAEIDAVDKNGETPLHIVVKNGSLEMIELLLDAGANPNIQNKNGETPLHIASEYEKIQAVELLINTKYIDINIRNQNGKTPLNLLLENIRNYGMFGTEKLDFLFLFFNHMQNKVSKNENKIHKNENNKGIELVEMSSKDKEQNENDSLNIKIDSIGENYNLYN